LGELTRKGITDSLKKIPIDEVVLKELMNFFDDSNIKTLLQDRNQPMLPIRNKLTVFTLQKPLHNITGHAYSNINFKRYSFR